MRFQSASPGEEVSASRRNVASLSLSVKEIPPEGTRITCIVGREELQLEEKDLALKDGLALTATVRAEDANFWVEGELNGLLVHECVRCLEEFTAPADLSFRALYKDLSRRRAKRQEPNAGPWAPDREKTDCHLVVEQQIELQEMLREQLILSIPMQPFCSEGCRGLCQVCGQNLNVQTCGCEEVNTKSPFAGLHDALKLLQKPLA